MPFNYRDFGKKAKSATLDLGAGDSISFAFRIGLITPQFLADYQSLNVASAITPELILAVSAHVARLLISWDMLDDDGVSMFPLDPARLAADIPLEAQMALLARCISETQPGEATAPEAPAAPVAN